MERNEHSEAEPENTANQIPDSSSWYKNLHTKYGKTAAIIALTSMVVLLSGDTTNGQEVTQSEFNSILNTPTPSLSAPPTETAMLTMTPYMIPTDTPLPVTPPTLTLTPETAPSGQIEFLGVSSMNQTKDKIRNPREPEWIHQFVQKAVELGATHVGVETPYNNPTNGNSVEYTKAWIDEIRSQNLKVIHRHMFIGFEENIYDVPQDTSDPFSYITKIGAYIDDHPEFFEDGDVFVPVPEPQNAGIIGANGCDKDGKCMFSSVDEFNQWIISAVEVSRQAFIKQNKNINVICCGFDGYITWGDNNTDRTGKSFLYPETIEKIGSIAVDHNPQDGATWQEDLAEFRQVFPDVPLYITEFGPVNRSSQSIIDTGLTFAEDGNIKGIMYWQMGPSGENETLLTENMENTPFFEKVKDVFGFLK